MSHRKPTKTQFIDLWRDDSSCLPVVKVDPSMETAWDNIDVGTWEKTETVPDPQAEIAKQICYACLVRESCIRDAVKDNAAEGLRGGYRFEDGTLTRREAGRLYQELGIRAKVSKKSRAVIPEVEDVESDDLQGVQEGE